MSSEAPDDRIQAEPSAASQRRQETADSPEEDAGSRRRSTRLAGTLFGALAGTVLGALVVAVCYWLADFGDYAWEGALYGASGGIFGGAVISFLERTFRGDLSRPDFATITGVLFGLIVAFLLLLGLGERVTGKGSGMLVIGLMCTGPMGGLLVGGMLDRAFEESLRRRWHSAIGFGGVAMAACVGIVFVIAEYSDPSPDEVVREARKLVADQWRTDPLLKDAKVRKMSLDRPVHRIYAGTMEASIAGLDVRFNLQVHVRQNRIKASWTPRE